MKLARLRGGVNHRTAQNLGAPLRGMVNHWTAQNLEENLRGAVNQQPGFQVCSTSCHSADVKPKFRDYTHLWSLPLERARKALQQMPVAIVLRNGVGRKVSTTSRKPLNVALLRTQMS